MDHDKGAIDAKTAALLVMDHQETLVNGYMPDPQAHLAAVAEVIAEARRRGIRVIYVRKAFRPGYPEVHDNNSIFAGVRAAGRLQEGDAAWSIPDRIAPAEDDLVVRGHRISAFEGTELSLLLRSAGIDTLIMFGIATSGVVLSTVRQAADLDYRLFVLRDLCGDNDPEVHNLLLDKVFPRQAAVLSSAQFFGSE